MTAALLLSLLVAHPVQNEYAPPNIVLIMVDDLGIDQLACYDDENHYDCPYPYAYTPYIDGLASIGVRFTQARATPLCSPTRAAIQSGRYPRRTGCGYIVPPEPTAQEPYYEFNVSPAPSSNTIADELHLRQYATAMFGKLHLHQELVNCPPMPNVGTGDDYAVSVLGYDLYRGIPRNPNTAPRPLTLPGLPVRGHEYRYYYWVTADSNGSVRELECGCPPCGSAPSQCDDVTCGACATVKCYDGTYATRKQRLALSSWISTAQEPYFALWNLHDIHGPLDWPPPLDAFTPPDVEGHYFGDPPSEPPNVVFSNTRLRAKLEYVDNSIGKLLAQIDLSDTVVMIVGDNGTQGPDPQTIEIGESAYPRGHPSYPYDPSPCQATIPPFSTAPYDTEHLKGSAYEGGVRVPLIVAGAGVDGGVISDALVDVVDFYETLRELAIGPGYVAPTPCSPAVTTNCSDSISFACILAGDCGASSHARQYSHAAIFRPNGSPVRPTFDQSCAREYYIRRDSQGRLWKIVRKYEPEANGGCYRDEFYNLVLDPLETSSNPAAPQYAATKAAFDAMFPPFEYVPGVSASPCSGPPTGQCD